MKVNKTNLKKFGRILSADKNSLKEVQNFSSGLSLLGKKKKNMLNIEV